jgi:putative effector of murein hydrolase LrgA (UPF0299 family)
MRISEQAVFRWVVIVAIAAASIAAVTLLTTPLAGALWALALLLAAALHAYRWWRGRDAAAGDRDHSRVDE